MKVLNLLLLLLVPVSGWIHEGEKPKPVTPTGRELVETTGDALRRRGLGESLTRYLGGGSMPAPPPEEPSKKESSSKSGGKGKGGSMDSKSGGKGKGGSKGSKSGGKGKGGSKGSKSGGKGKGGSKGSKSGGKGKGGSKSGGKGKGGSKGSKSGGKGKGGSKGSKSGGKGKGSSKGSKSGGKGKGGSTKSSKDGKGKGGSSSKTPPKPTGSKPAPKPTGKGSPPTGKGKGVGTVSCKVLPVLFYSKDITDGGYTNDVGFGLKEVPVYDPETLEQIGVYSDFAVDIPDSEECLVTGAYSLGTPDANGKYASQIELSFTCGSQSNAITGGTGAYGCASGFERFAFRDEAAGLLGTELNICGPLCPSP